MSQENKASINLGPKLDKLRGRSFSEAITLVFRKLVYRRVTMRRYGVVARQSTAPSGEIPLGISFVEPERDDPVLESTPYLSEKDLERFRASRSTCIVAKDATRIVGSSWMTRGSVYVTELQRRVPAPEHHHFSSRSYVAPAYRGMRLLSHMIYAYATNVAAPDDEVWGLVYDWNVASIRALERIGWRHDGTLGTITVFGVAVPYGKKFPPRAASHHTSDRCR